MVRVMSSEELPKGYQDAIKCKRLDPKAFKYVVISEEGARMNLARQVADALGDYIVIQTVTEQSLLGVI